MGLGPNIYIVRDMNHISPIETVNADCLQVGAEIGGGGGNMQN